jgi:hypothetical protein
MRVLDFLSSVSFTVENKGERELQMTKVRGRELKRENPRLKSVFSLVSVFGI